MHPLYGTITWEEPDIKCLKTELSNEHLKMFEGLVNLYRKSKVDSNNDYKDALITHFADARTPDPLSCGFSLRQPVMICGIQAHQTNNPDIRIIFLDQFQKAMPNVTFSCKDTTCNIFDLTFSHNLSEEKRYQFVLKEHKIFNRN